MLRDLSLTCESMVILACSEMFVVLFSSRIAFGLIMSILCVYFDSSHMFTVSLATSSVLISENIKIWSTFAILSRMS